MAGGGIVLSPYEWNAIRRLSRGDLANLLTTLDEDGWTAAQELLADYARRDAAIEQHYQQQTEGGNP